MQKPLVIILIAAILLFGCVQTEIQTKETPPDLSKVEELVFKYTNDERAGHRLEPLEYDGTLEEMAQWQSECLVEHNVYDHHTEECGALDKRVEQFNITDSTGENLFLAWDSPSYYDSGAPAGYYSEEEIARLIVDGWMDSPTHRENILDERYTHVGLGIEYRNDHAIIVTQNFFIEEYCGWENEPCCPYENDIYGCYEQWSCNWDTLECG